MSASRTAGGAPLAVRVVLLALGAAFGLLSFAADAVLGGAPGFGPQQGILLALGVSISASSLLPARVLANLLLAGVAVGLALVAAEIALRVVAGPRFATIYRLHPRHLHEMTPGASRSFTRHPENGGGSHLVEVNSLGYRGAELLPAGSRPRVVVYGDSFIAGEFSPLEETFVRQLGAQLEAKLGTPVEAVNAGVVSYGPDQISLRMEQELDSLAPDLVIVSVFADNDFGDLIRNKLFTLAPDGLLAANDFTIAPALESRFEMAQRGPYLYRAFTKLLAGLVVEKVGPEEQVERDLADCRREWREYVVEGDHVVRERMVGRYDADVSLEPESESARFKVRLMDRVLGRIAAIARERGVPLLLMIIPSPVDAVDHYELGRVDAQRHPAYRRTALTDAVAAAAAHHGIATVNLMEPFRARDAATLYLRGGDNHWNAAGQRLAAGAVADAIVAGNLMRAKDAAE